MGPAEPPEPTPAVPWISTLIQRVQKLEHLLPWFSLATGVVGAVWMDRSESSGALMASVGSAASWLVLVVLSLSFRPRAAGGADSTGALHKLVRFSSTTASQSLVQLALFFSGPFYIEAFVWTPLEALFGALFIVTCVVSLWDPLCNRVLLHPLLGPLLLAFSSFVAWNVTLPMLGVPQRTSVWLAAGAVAVAIPLVNVAYGQKRRLGSLAAGLSIPALLALGGVRALPPAPLGVVSAGIGTRIVERELVDPQQRLASAPAMLVCWTAIRAPHGLADKLVHVWRHDGAIAAEIALDVRGGRRAGFRTWSRLPLPRGARGTYRCDVLTALGQTVGGAKIEIGR